ncbi:MAG TPA: cysteine desulfurase family protein [Methylococcaceae bacterium]|nr:cysteine desulfurase family protein [Methylococcaceae bacterium]
MVYLDHNASTPVDERVVEAMLPYLSRLHGNPSSLHRFGRLARDALETAREQVAALAGASPGQVIFTSSGTEANNLALLGMAPALRGKTLAVGATEHPSVLEAAAWLHRHGHAVRLIPVDALGQVDAGLPGRLDDTIGLVSLMRANNETGVIHDPSPLGALRERGVWLHSDATQAAGRLPLDFASSGLHLMTLSAHKIYGPKGAGALIADRSLPLEPMLHGGGQERGLRAGTENVAALVGFGKAAELAYGELEMRTRHMLALRERFEAGLNELPGLCVFAAAAPRLANTVQFGMAGMDGEALVMALDRQGFALSSGSACASGAGQPSPVLLAMGVAPELARTAVRVSFGAGNTEQDVDALLATLCKLRPGVIHFG